MQKNNSKEIIEKMKDNYNLIAREWDLSRNRISDLKKFLMEDVKGGDRILDAGCGNALTLPFLLEKGGFYIGIDISEKLIEISRKKYAKEMEGGRVKFFIGGVTKLPFENDEFDFVISFAVLHHIPPKEFQEKFFQEIKRVSRPSAKIKIIVWNLLSEWTDNRFDVTSQLAGKKSGETNIPWKATSGKVVNRYIYQFSKEELFDLAESAGFINIKIDFFNRAGEIKENGEEMVLQMEK